MFSIVTTAQAAVSSQAFNNAIAPIVSNIVNPVIWLLFCLATVVFVYSVLKMVIKGEDAEAREASKKSILYGIIGMFIMLSAWGIVYLISNTIGAI